MDNINFGTALDTKDMRVIKNIKARRKIMFMTFSKNGGFIYTSDYFGNSVNVFNAYTGKELDRIPVPSPSGIFRAPLMLHK